MRPDFAFAVLPVLLACALLPVACSSEEDPSDGDDAAAAGPGGGGTGGGGGAGAEGGTGGTGGENPVAADCKLLCDYLALVQCDAFANCATDCPKMFGAPAECADEFAQLLSCWVGYKENFQCLPMQVLPPEECKQVEATFQLCVKGEVSGGCPGGVLNKSGDPPTACSRKTTCGTHTYQSVCQDQGNLWACSCYEVGVESSKTLIGTCTDPVDAACDNLMGCCAPFFIP